MINPIINHYSSYMYINNYDGVWGISSMYDIWYIIHKYFHMTIHLI